MYNFIDTKLTVGSNGGSFGYNSVAGFGSVTDGSFYDGSIRNLIDGTNSIQLMINGSVDQEKLPSILYLVVDGGEPIKLTRQDVDRWNDFDSGRRPFFDAVVGTEVSVQVFAPTYDIILLDLDLTRTNTGNDGQFVRLCTHSHDVEYNGYNYQAVGDLLEIEGITEEIDLVTKGTVIRLNGIDPSYRAEIDRNAFRLAPIDLLIGVLPVGMNEIQEARYWHRGRCDSPNTVIDYTGDANQLVIEVSTESILGNLDKVPDLIRTSQSSHEATHNGDKFFTYVADVSLTEEVWKS